MHLKKARFIRGKTQFELRLLTGIHQSRISVIEKGYVVPRDDEKERLEAALNTKIDWDENIRQKLQEIAQNK